MFSNTRFTVSSFMNYEIHWVVHAGDRLLSPQTGRSCVLNQALLNEILGHLLTASEEATQPFLLVVKYQVNEGEEVITSLATREGRRYAGDAVKREFAEYVFNLASIDIFAFQIRKHAGGEGCTMTARH